MKRIIATTILVLAATTAWAHSGGTDAIGCHYDRQTGIYHCH